MVTVVYRFRSSSESNPSSIEKSMSSVVTSSQRQAKHLPWPRPACAAAGGSALTRPSPRREVLARLGQAGAGLVVPVAQRERGLRPRQQPGGLGVFRRGVPGDGPRCEHARRGLARHVCAGVLVPARLGAGLEEQRARRDAPAGDRHQVAVDAAIGPRVRLAVAAQGGDHRSLHLLAAEGPDHDGAAQQRDALPLQPRRELLVGPRGAGVGDPRDGDPRVVQGERGLEPAIGGGRDHRAFPGPDAVERREPLGAGAQHHPGEVVALEHQGLLDRAGRGDVGAGPDLMQRAAAPDRHEPVEPADRGRRREDLHPGPRNPRGQLLGLAGHVAGEN